MSASILVTGGAGFIGSHFIDYLLGIDSDCSVVNLDKLTYAANLENLISAESNPNYTFVKGCIGDRRLVKELFERYKISGVIHFAAESHVDNSIESPQDFIETNVLGTQVLLEASRQYWKSENEKTLDSPWFQRFLHISTDEVFGSIDEGKFTEDSKYAPNSPYAASKAASDLLVRSYSRTYQMNTVVTHCSNNFGSRQHEEKLIPTVISKALKREPIPIYGSGKNIRDWIHVKDHCCAIHSAFFSGMPGESYNFGGGQEKENIALTHFICDYLDEVKPTEDRTSYRSQITFVEDRAAHDFRYAVDFSKSKQKLGWAPLISFESGLEETIDWYLEHLYV